MQIERSSRSWPWALLLALTLANGLALVFLFQRTRSLERLAEREAQAEVAAARTVLTRERVDPSGAPALRILAARLQSRTGHPAQVSRALEVACLHSEARLDEAIRQGRQWLEQAGGEAPWLRWRLALALLAGQRAAEAVDELERVVGALPELPAARHRLGAAYALTGRGDDAVRTLGEAVTAGAGPGAALDLARSLSAAGRHADAAPHLEAFVKLQGEHAEALRLLAMARFHLDHAEEAARLYERSWRVDREPRTLVSAAVAWRKAGDEPRAQALMRRVQAPGVAGAGVRVD